jgi:hypothetical protein
MENEKHVSYFLYLYFLLKQKNRAVKKIKCCPLNLQLKSIHFVLNFSRLNNLNFGSVIMFCE